MTKREKILEEHPDAVFVDGMDKAITGYCLESGRVIYSRRKMLIRLMLDEDMKQEEAVEFLTYNVICAHVGEQTPIFMEEL
jgi:DNA-directed RNA polymerase beta' subunit